MAKEKIPSAKYFANLLFLKNNKEVLEALRLSRYDSPLAIVSAATLRMLSFFSLLAKIAKKKPDFLEKVLKEYERLLKSKWATEEIALIKTAVPLTPEEKVTLAERLAEIFGHYLKLKIEVRPELIGGMVIQVGEKVIDRSLIAKIEKLKEHLKGGKGG